VEIYLTKIRPHKYCQIIVKQTSNIDELLTTLTETTMRKIKTKYGLANINNWGQGNCFQITIDPVYELPETKRRIRGNIPKYIEPENLKEWVINSIEKKIEQTTKKRPVAKHKPIPFIKNYYFDYMDTQAQVGAPLPTKSNWSEYKVYLDKLAINKYLIPFIREYGLDWDDFNLRNTTIFLDWLRAKGLSDRTIQVQKGAYNLLFREAIKHDLMNDLPKYPKLNDAPQKHGIRITAYGRATDDMIRDLIDVCKERAEQTKRLTTESIWSRKLCLQWLYILIDTGIRPFSKSPLTFNDLIDVEEGIVFWRHEKNNEYKAQGGETTKKALLKLKTMYLEQGIQPNHILSKTDGTKAKNIDRILREAVRIAWGDKADIDGRVYKAYSIRKWHINKSLNQGEKPYACAERVGHRLETLLEYYLDPDNIEYSRPNVTDDILNKPNKVKSIA